MSDAPAAGWYRDPAGEHAMRWWDGSAWTQHVDDPAPAPPPPAVPVASAYQPFGALDAELAASAIAKPASNVIWTPAVSWIAFSPIWITLVDFLALSSLYGMVPGMRQWSGVASLIWIVPLCILAMRDRSALLRAGHPRAASAVWMLLSPIAYLIARRIRVKQATGGGAGPGNVFAALLLLPLAILFFFALVPVLYSSGL
jgi:hypothetical protein